MWWLLVLVGTAAPLTAAAPSTAPSGSYAYGSVHSGGYGSYGGYSGAPSGYGGGGYYGGGGQYGGGGGYYGYGGGGYGSYPPPADPPYPPQLPSWPPWPPRPPSPPELPPFPPLPPQAPEFPPSPPRPPRPPPRPPRPPPRPTSPPQPFRYWNRPPLIDPNKAFIAPRFSCGANDCQELASCIVVTCLAQNETHMAVNISFNIGSQAGACKSSGTFSWACCKDTPEVPCDGQGPALCNGIVTNSTGTCNAVSWIVFWVPLYQDSIIVQVHDGQLGGNTDCAATKDCCAGYGGGCKTTVCTITIDLTSKPNLVYVSSTPSQLCTY
ncbi:hypothetical protein HYH02_007750 [Chlamydomonas schloesseri]|uniref:Uncharacterized protein n=1 Tax=Chlamydomonas schloesseri TaxID=2026947 RepID=A0A835WHN8_9CHLO|nr:hypothetical protein HYH02_007750 [Chlamydomonas schloesseri]|eukprot:KAG2447424.1 hypothetical protein HYH02_007750 [Chlamydomonas schloesseri]